MIHFLHSWMNSTNKETKFWPPSILPSKLMTYHVGIHLHHPHHILPTLITSHQHIPPPTMNHHFNHPPHHIDHSHISLHPHLLHIHNTKIHPLHPSLPHQHTSPLTKLHTTLHQENLHLHLNPPPIGKALLMLSLTTPTWMIIPKSLREFMPLIRIDP